MSNIITIIGASGFLGIRLASFFKRNNYSVIEINKNSKLDFTANYGTIFYCAGVPIDFQNRIFDTIDAHVLHLRVWLEKAQFDKFVYISSTRIYLGQDDTSEDKDLFIIDRNDIYNTTKIMGELVCLSSKRPVVILRVSNVVGYDENSPYFLWSVFRQAKQNHTVHIQETKASSRDYLYLDDFLSLSYKITQHSIEGIYNVASSITLSHLELENIINKQYLCEWFYGQKNINYPRIYNEKIKRDLNFRFSNPNEFISHLFSKYRMAGKYTNE